MTNRRILSLVASVFWIAALQATFFWIARETIECAAVVYGFYSALSIGHIVLLFILADKLGSPAAIAPAIAGSVINVGQIAMSLSFLLFNISMRRALFAEMVVLFLYIAAVAIITSASYGDSSHYGTERIPVRPYEDNPERSVRSSHDCHTDGRALPVRRMPKAH